MGKKIIMLAGKGSSTLFMYNGIKGEYQIDKVIIEKSVSKKIFIKRRIKKLGLARVFGQIMFQIVCVKLLNITSKKRVQEIKTSNKLSDKPIPEEILIEVPSVNSNECKTLLQKLNPDIIIVNGTRIISKKTLNSTNAVLVNTHAGITPNYRGVHGAYWALANNDRNNCGVTVHLVDPGIDTGGILYQENIEVINNDNFTTYTYLQIAKGIKLMKKALDDIINNNISINKKNSESNLWSHPTIWKYYWYRIIKRVK